MGARVGAWFQAARRASLTLDPHALPSYLTKQLAQQQAGLMSLVCYWGSGWACGCGRYRAFPGDMRSWNVPVPRLDSR